MKIRLLVLKEDGQSYRFLFWDFRLSFFLVKTKRKFPSNDKKWFGKSQNDFTKVLMSF